VWELSGIIAAVVVIVTPLVCLLLWLMLKDYVKGYAGKKGETLVTHEDIQKIVAQVQAVTQTTKEIEAKISDQSWSHQRLISLKTEKAFEMMNNFGSMDQLLSDMLGCASERRTPGGIGNERPWTEGEQTRFMDRQRVIAERQWQLDAVMGLFFSHNVIAQSRLSIRDAQAEYSLLAQNSFSQGDSNEALRTYRETRGKLEAMLREEIAR
jgi:hypothetical protein